jgi:hypothetical protein
VPLEILVLLLLVTLVMVIVLVLINAQSFFGGPEARLRVEALSGKIIELHGRIKATKCQDSEVTASFESAQAWLNSAWDTVTIIDHEHALDAYLWGAMSRANSQSARGELEVRKAHKLMDAIGCAPFVETKGGPTDALP